MVYVFAIENLGVLTSSLDTMQNAFGYLLLDWNILFRLGFSISDTMFISELFTCRINKHQKTSMDYRKIQL